MPSSSLAGHRPTSFISALAQSSRQPVTLSLNLRGRLAYSRLPVKKSEISRAISEASKTSSASTPATGQPRTLRAESPHACTVVIPTCSSRAHMRGTSPMWTQWSCTS